MAPTQLRGAYSTPAQIDEPVLDIIERSDAEVIIKNKAVVGNYILRNGKNAKHVASITVKEQDNKVTHIKINKIEGDYILGESKIKSSSLKDLLEKYEKMYEPNYVRIRVSSQ